MLDSDIITLCMEKFRKADSATSTIQKERQDTLKYYRCEPFGDEKEGLSKFVSSDVRDTVEWMLPQIVEMFITGDAFEFSAKNEADADQAKLETNYVDHVYNEQNNGYLNTYTWVKDGLMGKNGIAKIYWDEKVDELEEDYEDLSFDSFQKILADPEVEVVEATAELGEQEISLEELFALPPEVQIQAKFDVKCNRKEDNSKAMVTIIPPENFFVEEGHNSLDLENVGFCCHRETVTASDLIVDGYSKKLIDSIPTGDDNDLDPENAERFDDAIIGDNEQEADREITIYECYVKIDTDGDGKTEYRLIKLAGTTGSVILENEKVDSNPFAAWSPVINTHQFYGMSYADLVMDIQLLRSTLIRQMLNNLYMVNHPAKGVIENQIYKEDFLNTGPGAIYRMKSAGAIENLVTPFVGEATIPVLSMVEEMRRERTGVSPVSQGLDPKSLSDATNDVMIQTMTQAMQRIKMVARNFGETGFKTAMLKIQALCSKYDKPRDFQMEGQWQTVDPREWAKRTRYKVKVGVGHADKMTRLSGIGTIIANLKEIAMTAGLESPLAGSENLYSAYVEQAKLLGYVDGAKFYRDPKTYQPPETGPSEAIQITEATTVADLTKSKANNDLELQKHNEDLALKKYIADQNYDLGLRKLDQDKEMERERILFNHGTKSGSKVGFEDARNDQG